MMTTAANRLAWWAACRDVVAELRRRFREGFLNDPSCAVSREDEARDHICQSEWFQKLAQEAGRTTEAEIHRLLSAAHLAANQSLSDGRWKTEFAGKEILRDVGSRICDHTEIPGHSTTRTLVRRGSRQGGRRLATCEQRCSCRPDRPPRRAPATDRTSPERGRSRVRGECTGAGRVLELDPDPASRLVTRSSETCRRSRHQEIPDRVHEIQRAHYRIRYEDSIDTLPHRHCVASS